MTWRAVSASLVAISRDNWSDSIVFRLQAVVPSSRAAPAEQATVRRVIRRRVVFMRTQSDDPVANGLQPTLQAGRKCYGSL